MADYGSPVGGLLQGFNQTYWPGVRQNEAMLLQQAQEKRAQALYDLQVRKLNDAEEKDKQAAGLYAGMLGIKPTTVDDSAVNQMDPSRPELIWKNGGDSTEYVDSLLKANPQYEQLLAGGSKAAADLVKQGREQQMAELKARTDAWKETQAQRMADLKDKQIMAMMARVGQGAGASKQPVAYIDPETGKAVWGLIPDARGKEAAGYSPSAAGAKASAVAAGTAQGKRDYNMQGVGEVIDSAERLLMSNPTASGVGAMADRAAATVGYATPGSIPAQELKQLGGFLTAKMPRMEGPQSDKDVMLYREMAGMVGDDTVPIERRLAALKSVRNIVAKYDKTYQGGSQPGPSVRVFNPKTGRLE